MVERTIEPILLDLSRRYPVVTITGPGRAGKPLSAAGLPETEVRQSGSPDVRRFAIEDPRGFLAAYPDGAILDEIQRVPELPSYIQEIVDADKEPGRFILTGSQQFEVMNTISQSLAGRTALLKLLPFSSVSWP